MATNETTNVKEFLQRVNITTMRKDLKQLRESDSLQEREKISKIKTVKNDGKEKKFVPEPHKFDETIKSVGEEIPPVGIDAILDKELSNKNIFQDNEKIPNAAENSFENIYQPAKPLPSKLEKILDHSLDQEKDAMVNARQYANENEKEQIFLLESQKTNLENQIKEVERKNGSDLLLGKNDILLRQKDLQKKLEPLIQEEEKNEKEQITIQQAIASSNVPTQKQNLEKEKWALEDKKQGIEKKRWSIEADLSALEENIKDIDHQYGQLALQKDTLINDIKNVEDSLKEIYLGILEKEKNKRNTSAVISLKEAQQASEQIEKLQKQQEANSQLLQEKEFLKGVPDKAKQTLAMSTEKENERRKKFMEDVEAWANVSAKDNSN